MRDEYDPALVSIIMPAFQAERHINAAINSVRSQTYPHWELLVADDGSRDRTREIVQEWSRRDPRVRLVEVLSKGGPAGARNAALAAAKGRWVAFLDSDDEWLPTKLEVQRDFQLRHHAVLSCTSFRRVSDETGSVGRVVRAPRRLGLREALGNTGIATSTAMVDRAISGDFRMKVTHCDDFATWVALIRANPPAVGLDEDLMRYRVSRGSYSRNKFKYALRVWRTYRIDLEMPLVQAIRYFAEYAIRGVLKYSRF